MFHALLKLYKVAISKVRYINSVYVKYIKNVCVSVQGSVCPQKKLFHNNFKNERFRPVTHIIMYDELDS